MDIPPNYERWALEYKKFLESLSNDIRSLDAGFDIYIAIDFHELYEYCFPVINLIKREDWNSPEAEQYRNTYIRNQLSRVILFFLLKQIYPNKILLLPPYLREANDYYKSLTHGLVTHFDDDKIKNNTRKLILNIYSELKMVKDENRYEKLVNILAKNSPELMLIFSDTLQKGIKAFAYMMQNCISPDPSIISNDTPNSKNKIMDLYISIFEEIKKNGNDNINSIIQEVRDKPEKAVQNKRDAEAVRYILELNKQLIKEKKFIFLVTSSPHMLKLKKIYKFNQNVEYDSFTLNFEIIRDLDFFYNFALEAARANEDCIVDLENLNLRKLHDQVNTDLFALENLFFACEEASQAKFNDILGDTVREQNLDALIQINENLNNINLSTYIQNFFKKYNDETFLPLLEIDFEGIRKEFRLGMEMLKKISTSPEFSNKIFEKVNYLEKERLSYLWPLGLGYVPIYNKDRALDIVLFDLPFKLDIKDIKSSVIVNNFTELNSRAKLEIKKNYEIQAETLNLIYSELQKLSLRIDELNDDEKYVLMQMIFSCIGRLDLIEFFYKYIINKVSDLKVLRELSYIYANNFVKLVRKEGKNKIEFEELIELTKNYAINYYQNIPLRFNNLERRDNQELKNELSNLGLHMPDDHIFLKLNEKINIFYNKDLIPNEIYLFENKGETVNLNIIDLRFIHLRSIIINRYIKDYGILEDDPVFNILTEFKNIIFELEHMIFPLIKNIFLDFEVPITADYCYSLSLNKSDSEYFENLKDARDKMNYLESRSNRPEWDYTKWYILGYIYFNLINEVPIERKGQRKHCAEKANIYFQRSIKELPFNAKGLRKILFDLMDNCEKIIVS